MSAADGRRTKIVATIGPASRDSETLARMVEAGLDVARLNLSHGSPEEHAATADRVRDAASRAGRPVGILQDLPGPKLRIGPLREGVAELKPGDRLTLACGSGEEGDAQRMTVAWEGLSGAVGPGDVVYLADGSVRLRVVSVREGACEIDAAVELGGAVSSRQGLNVPGELAALPSMPEEDLDLLRFGESIGVDMVALSFVRREEDVSDVRRHTRSPLIAKVEKRGAVDNAEAIIHAADCVMVARGDLGIELPIEEVPLVQKRILALAGRRAKPTITATQMLESMVHSTRPTRAEVADVANAIFDGTDAVMLSQETAVGQHPVGAVEMMAAIATTTERELPYGRWLAERGPRANNQYHAISFGAVGAVYQLGLKAIVSPTRTGTTARLISAYRPRAPVLALSMYPDVVRQCCLLWGVHASLNEEPQHTTELIDSCAQAALDEGLVEKGDTIGITAGLPAGRSGGTNLFKLHVVE